MTTNLLEAFKGLLTPDLVGRMASATGESEGAVSKALAAAAPLIVSGLVERTAEPARLSQLTNLLTSPASSASALSNLGSLFATGQAESPLIDMGSNFLSAIFGNRLDAVTGALGQYTGSGRRRLHRWWGMPRRS